MIKLAQQNDHKSDHRRLRIQRVKYISEFRELDRSQASSHHNRFSLEHEFLLHSSTASGHYHKSQDDLARRSTELRFSCSPSGGIGTVGISVRSNELDVNLINPYNRIYFIQISSSGKLRRVVTPTR
jgi:hypothetical protein